MHLTALLAAAVALSNMSEVSSFIATSSTSHHHRAVTSLNLEDQIAEMIDNEYERLENFFSWKKKQDEKLAKSRKEHGESIPQGFDFNSVNDFQPNTDATQKIQMRKDKRMARDDPARYCADRCVATGNCQVWEDMFDMAADEVQQFCNECVLSEDEEPCEVPDKFIENAGLNPWELKP